MSLNPFKRGVASVVAPSVGRRAADRRQSESKRDQPVVKKAGRSAWLEEALARKAFKKWKVRRNLYRRLAVRVKNGSSVEDVLETEASALATDGDPSAFVLREASRLMRNGHSLSEALKKWVPADEMGVLATSEAGDALSESLEYFIETRRRMTRVKTSFRNAVVQPVVYSFTVYAVLWSIAKYSVPKLASSNAAAHATGSAKMLLGLSAMVNSWQGMVPPALFLVGAVVIARSFTRWTGPLRVLAEQRFPYSYYRDSEGFVWLSGYVSLMQAGKADVDILSTQAKYASPWLRERLSHYKRSMVNGKSLAQALLTPMRPGKPAFGFPNRDIINDIAAMNESDEFPQKMREVLSNWADELEESTLEKSKVFGFALEICMYVIMGLLMMGMNSLVSQVAGTH
jgi:type II secretory pathway component PulF